MAQKLNLKGKSTAQMVYRRFLKNGSLLTKNQTDENTTQMEPTSEKYLIMPLH